LVCGSVTFHLMESTISDQQKLFLFFLVFIFINACLYLLLAVKYKKKTYYQLAWYWLALILAFFVEALLIDSDFKIHLAFVFNIPPILIISKIYKDSFDEPFNIWPHVALGVLSFTVSSYLLYYEMVPFVYGSFILTFSTSLPLFQILFETIKKSRTMNLTVNQLLLAWIGLPLGIFGCLNYSFNRLNPEAFYWGFGSAFMTYILHALILPALILEKQNAQKAKELEDQILQRTADLNSTLSHLQFLNRVVSHDISNNIQNIYHLPMILSRSEDSKMREIGELLNFSLYSIKDLINHVRELDEVEKGKINFKLKIIDIDQCFLQLKNYFQYSFKEKNVQLSFINSVPMHITFYADETSLVRIVLPNLIGNALKFSKPNSLVEVKAYLENELVTLEVVDQGCGMQENELKEFLIENRMSSKKGTLGEKGSGIGLSLVRNYVKLYDAQIKIESLLSKYTRVRIEFLARKKSHS